MTGVRRTALVVVVPQAEHLVADLRMQHDRMAALGVPAHVTVLHPFTPHVDSAMALRVASVCATVQPFDATFASVGRFAGGVVWLRPEPHDRFHALLTAMHAAIPEWPPYGGAYDEPHPHLTVSSGVDEAVADRLQQSLTDQLAVRRPVASPIHQLTLLEEGFDLRWTTGRTWPLGAHG